MFTGIPRFLLPVLLLCGLFMLPVPAMAETDIPTVTNAVPATSGMPIPRFVTLRSTEVNLRAGPSVRYPIEWVYSKEGLPVEVTAEFDTWRRIRDKDGTEGWVHQSMLSGKRSILVGGTDLQPVYAKAESTADIIAKAEPQSMGDLLNCENAWCEVKFAYDSRSIKGYMPKGSFWGAYADEVIN